jgi:SH3-like domain-containing protein
MKSFPLLVLCAATFAAAAHAAEFKSVGGNPAILYDAPTERGRKVFVAPRGMPVEVVLTYGEWSKVRDVSGDLSWIDSKALTAKRMLIVKAPTARVHGTADDASAVVMSVERGVLLELAEPVASSWIKVRHRDGQTGFVRTADVWGD